MKNKFIILISLTFSLLTAPVFATDQLVITDQQIKNMGIQLSNPVSIQEVPLFKVPATIAIPPSQNFIVSTSYAGVIKKVLVSVGETIQRGQLLARIFSPEYLELQREFLASFSENELASMKLEHDEMLYKEGVVSHHRFLESRITANQAEARLSQYKELLKMSGLSDIDIRKLANKRQLRSYLNLTSPTSGVVLESKMVTGQQVDKLAPVFRVANLQKLYVELAVPQERLSGINIGGLITVGKTGVEGKVILIGRNVDQDSQSILVRAVIDEHPEILHPGQNVIVQLFSESEQAIFQVPTAAVIRRGGNHYLFRRTKLGFEAKQVDVVGRDPSSVVVDKGITLDDKVVIKGTAALKLFWLEMGGGE